MAPDVIAGRYRLGDLLGAGGFGRVYAARDLRLEREVAVKLVSIDDAKAIDPAVVRRFVDEARTGARFTHPHAVTVFDAGRNDRYLYLVTELVRGSDLADHVARNGPLSIDEATRVADQILQALDAAHRAGIVHRDVKPSNVLIDEHGDVKLADFGIAKRLDDLQASVTSTGLTMGTPHYVAPERTAGEPATPAADVYAVGVVLYEMLTGRPPYDGDSPIAVALAHRDAPLPDVVRWRPDTPPALSAAIRRALAKDPRDRFADAGAMRYGLTHLDVGASATVPAAISSGSRDEAATRHIPAIGPAPGAGDRSDAHAGDNRRRRPPLWWWWFAAAALIGLAVWAAVALGDDDPSRASTSTSSVPERPPGTTERAAPVTTPSTTAPPTTAAPTTTTTTVPPTTTSPTTTITMPDVDPLTDPELAALIDRLAAAPEAAGKHGDKLLHELEKVAERSGPERGDRALKTIDHLTRWMCDGSIDPTLAGDSLRVLLGVVATSGVDLDSLPDLDALLRSTFTDCRDGVFGPGGPDRPEGPGGRGVPDPDRGIGEENEGDDD